LKPRDAVRHVERRLITAGVPQARTDAEILVAHVLGVPRSTVAARDDHLDARQLERLQALAERRRTREPLQHLLGEWGFRNLTLAVDRRALVPRPETEVTVERALARIERIAAPRVLDVGTGSGAIALAILDEHPVARVTAVEASQPAIELARENAARAGYSDRLELIVSDIRCEPDPSNSLLLALEGERGFDLVVSNPPYIPEVELARLEPEVREHDPREAIVEAGLTEAVARAAPAVLRSGGWLVLECGDGQDEALADLLRSLGYLNVTVTSDLAGIPRVVEGRR
jgi:release factor glutamine methyltransferase